MVRMGRIVRKPLVVVVCTLAILVGMVAFAAPAHAASGGGCSYQNIPVRSCISVQPNSHLFADFYRDSWPPNCYEIDMRLFYDVGGWSLQQTRSCSTYHGWWDAGHTIPGQCIQNRTTMYYSDGSGPTDVWSPAVCT
jgi:hypothetical protein